MRIIELPLDDGAFTIEIEDHGAGEWARCYMTSPGGREFMGASGPVGIATWLLDALLDRTTRRPVAKDPDWRVVMALAEAHRFLLDCRDPISGFHCFKWVEGDGTGELIARFGLGSAARLAWIDQLRVMERSG
jgi:hypothetical protein